MKFYDLIICGAGASGLAAAISAARSGTKNIAIIEKKKQAGRKIAASGNGRCNMTNTNAEGYDKCIAFFESIGVLTRSEDEGRVYPYSEDAKDVVRALEAEAKRLGVHIFTDTEVLSIRKLRDKTGEEFFEAELKATDGSARGKAKADHAGGAAKGKAKAGVMGEVAGDEAKAGAMSGTGDDEACHAGGLVRGKACLVACGGKAAPKLGTTGDGFRFAKSFGHSVSRLIPVLTAVELCREPAALGLSGVRQKGKVSLMFRGETLVEESGEIQFTPFGLSGICIFNISRYMMIPEGRTLRDGFDDYEIVIDFMPEYTQEEVREIVKRSGESLCSIVKEPLAKVITEKKISGEEPFVQLKSLRFKPKGAKGWDFAQVTRGGVSLDEIDESYMSKKCEGLFFSGEVLDFDGKCGGYNLTFAWLSGISAGEGISKYLTKE